ncbi:hypothetical protein L5D93_03000 [Paenibacillus thiaminolyticus]|nr:hypothetical protein [Paenibacillus thiaminolyticus]
MGLQMKRGNAVIPFVGQTMQHAHVEDEATTAKGVIYIPAEAVLKGLYQRIDSNVTQMELF